MGPERIFATWFESARKGSVLIIAAAIFPSRNRIPKVLQAWAASRHDLSPTASKGHEKYEQFPIMNVEDPMPVTATIGSRQRGLVKPPWSEGPFFAHSFHGVITTVAAPCRVGPPLHAVGAEISSGKIIGRTLPQQVDAVPSGRLEEGLP